MVHTLAGASCTFRGCSNPFGQRQSESANIECGAPRKRRKYDFQNLKKHTSQAYLHMKGEPPRGGALTREEFSVVEGHIQLSLASGKELNTSSLLTHYNHVQSISFILEPKSLLLRKKNHLNKSSEPLQLTITMQPLWRRYSKLSDPFFP